MRLHVDKIQYGNANVLINAIKSKKNILIQYQTVVYGFGIFDIDIYANQQNKSTSKNYRCVVCTVNLTYFMLSCIVKFFTNSNEKNI